MVMNVSMSPSKYKALPSRQTMRGLPVVGAYYRDEAHPALVFKCMRSGSQRVEWAAFGWKTPEEDRF
jgi:hypothetical protein